MDRPIKVEIPPELLPYLEDEPEKKVKLLLVFELYREQKKTLRQAADILKLSYREMDELLGKHSIYWGFDKEYFEEELKYWHEGTEELRKRQELLKQRQAEKLSRKKTS